MAQREMSGSCRVAQFIAVCRSVKRHKHVRTSHPLSNRFRAPRRFSAMPVLSHLPQLFNAEQCQVYMHTLRWKDRPRQCPRCQSHHMGRWGTYQYRPGCKRYWCHSCKRTVNDLTASTTTPSPLSHGSRNSPPTRLPEIFRCLRLKGHTGRAQVWYHSRCGALVASWAFSSRVAACPNGLVREKKQTNHGPVLESTSTHCLYPLPGARGRDFRADRKQVRCDAPSQRGAGTEGHERINQRRPGASVSRLT
jgi:transposase-like protein